MSRKTKNKNKTPRQSYVLIAELRESSDIPESILYLNANKPFYTGKN